MTLKEIKQKTLVLIEEYSPNGKQLTTDSDIENKMNPVVNQVMYELCRIKKIPKYVEMKATAGSVIDFETIGKECGYEIYQINAIKGVHCEEHGDGTIFKFLEDGTAKIDVFVFPESITAKTNDSYEFELSADVLEIMPYGIAADLLSTDVSSNYKEFKQRYETMLSRLDTRNQLPTVRVTGGVAV